MARGNVIDLSIAGRPSTHTLVMEHYPNAIPGMRHTFRHRGKFRSKKYVENLLYSEMYMQTMEQLYADMRTLDAPVLAQDVSTPTVTITGTTALNNVFQTISVIPTTMRAMEPKFRAAVSARMKYWAEQVRDTARDVLEKMIYSRAYAERRISDRVQAKTIVRGSKLPRLRTDELINLTLAYGGQAQSVMEYFVKQSFGQAGVLGDLSETEWEARQHDVFDSTQMEWLDRVSTGSKPYSGREVAAARKLLRLPFYRHTFILYQAVMRGIFARGMDLNIGIDQSAFPGRPYWAAVEYGHRVVLPHPKKGTHDTGNMVPPKPFWATIINRVMTQLLPRIKADMRSGIEGVRDAIVDITSLSTAHTTGQAAAKSLRQKVDYTRSSDRRSQRDRSMETEHATYRKDDGTVGSKFDIMGTDTGTVTVPQHFSELDIMQRYVTDPLAFIQDKPAEAAALLSEEFGADWMSQLDEVSSYISESFRNILIRLNE